MYLTDEIDFNKLGDLVLHCSGSLKGKLSPFLPYWVAAQGDIKSVDYYLEGDSWHVDSEPYKDIHILLKRGGQCVHILRVYPRTDPHLFVRTLIIEGY